ncbi:MAG: phosphatidylserine decarboxylase [Rhodospirillaceae bacterium]|nr:phosphatidylserine decarboxylase [Rhodospirillaceae bacterium]
MKLKLILPALFVLLIALGGYSFWELSGRPGTSDLSQGKEYERHVPENTRTLVPQSQYDAITSALGKPGKGEDKLDPDTIHQIAASPCGPSLNYLITQFRTNPAVPQALEAVRKGLQAPPTGYFDATGAPLKNPWRAKTATELRNRMVKTFLSWCVFLPEISGTSDNGLKYILDFAWFYYQNEAGQDFVQGINPLNLAEPLPTGWKFTKDFSVQRGAYMDSPASTAMVAQWANDPRIEIEDYQKQNSADYKSWNNFFARELTVDDANQTIPSRPATMPLDQYPERDYIVVSPTDCIMNPLVQVLSGARTAERKIVENPLQYNTVLDVKGIPLSLAQLLEGVPQEYRDKFVGGSGQSCVLMPNTYHHYHAPVNGTVVHAAVIQSNTYGYLDFPNWAPLSGNVGQPGTDFSQFQNFQRGVVIIEVKYAGLQGKEITGYVASIPVGLDTIGSVTLNKEIVPGKVVKRGFTEIGNFYYGGSLNILLYSKGLAGNPVQTRMGNLINLFNVGTSP